MIKKGRSLMSTYVASVGMGRVMPTRVDGTRLESGVWVQTRIRNLPNPIWNHRSQYATFGSKFDGEFDTFQ